MITKMIKGVPTIHPTIVSWKKEPSKRAAKTKSRIVQKFTAEMTDQVFWMIRL